MKSRFQEIYNYCFNDYANIDESIKNTPAAHQSKQKARKIASIKNLFMEEKSPLIYQHHQEKFRIALRRIRAKSLESVLFGDFTTPLDKKTYPWPDDTDIELQFHQFENEHHFFNDDEQKQALEKFICFFKLCKLAGDFIELNNTDNNMNAYQHAYKMVILFGEEKDPKKYFQSFEKYIKTHNIFEKSTPIHDALIWNLPKNKPPQKINLSVWRSIIQAGGNKAFRLFNLAPLIEKKIRRAPKDLKEAMDVAKKLTYKKSALDPELAELCVNYGVPETTFNRCLKLKSKIKKYDNLPNVIIDGSDVGKPGYYLVKLPINDPRAFILGQMTNCCQSIDGASEKCVIDGLTRANNGFYILLKDPERKEIKDEKITSKQESKHTEKSNEEINTQIKKLIKKCKLVGQGYAWISKNDNLTIDSWENLNPDAENSVIVPMLKLFGKTVSELKDHFISKVTIGIGGKTPREFNIRASSPEKPLEGYHYGDSAQQSVIYVNENKLQQAKEFKNKILEDIEINFKNFLEKDEKQLINEKIDLVKKLFDIDLITISSLQKLKNISQHPKFITYLNKPQKFSMLSKILEYERICKILKIYYVPLGDLLLTAPQNKAGEYSNISTIIKSTLAKYIKLKNRLFYLSIQGNEIEAFNKLLEEKPNLNARIGGELSNHYTPLSAAIHNNNLAMINKLLEAKANINHTDSLGTSPINAAIVYGDVNLVRFLLDSHADVNISDNFKETPLHNAFSRNRDIQVIHWLLEAKANHNATNHLGNTPLHIAAEYGHLEGVKLLLSRHCKINAKNDQNENAFMLALEEKKFDIVNILLEAKSEINIKNKSGLSPLYHAAKTANVALLKKLLEAKANPNEKSDLFDSPLGNAAFENQLEMAALLLKYNADINAKGFSKRTPLHNAVYEFEILKLLLDAKPNLNLIDDDGKTPLCHAARQGKPESIKLLIESKADVNLADKEGLTPLHHLAKQNNLELCKLLVTSKANVNAKDSFGHIPLYYLNSENRTQIQLKSITSEHVSWLQNQLKKMTQHEDKSSTIKISKLIQDIDDVFEEKATDTIKFFDVIEILIKTLEKSVNQYESLKPAIKKSLVTNNPYESFIHVAITSLLHKINENLTLIPFELPSNKFKSFENDIFDPIPSISMENKHILIKH